MVIDTNVNEGPAITSIEYKIDPKTAEEFLQAMKEMKRIRLRDGAIRWNLLRDSADPQRYVEIFVTESWESIYASTNESPPKIGKQRSALKRFTLAIDRRGLLTSSRKNCRSDLCGIFGE